MKLLILSPNQLHRKNWTHQIFRNEFSKHHITTYYGEGYPNYIPNKPIPEVFQEKDFDLILSYGLKYTEPFIGIGEMNIPKAHIVVDYFDGIGSGSGTYERNHRLFNRDKYDIFFPVVGHELRNLKKNGYKKSFLLPFSIDSNIYTNGNGSKEYDVFACFTTKSDTYPNRNQVQRMIKGLSDLKSFIGKAEHQKYINLINKSRVCITSNNRFKSLSIKYYEIMSCGSFLLADRPEDFEELGFVDRQHLVLYNDLVDLKDKIYYYLRHTKEREQVAREGMRFIRENHTNEIRVKQFTKIIQEEFGIK